MTPKEKALKLCQTFGMTTLFHPDCNDGVTLPLSVAKKCALIAVEEVLNIKKEIWDDFHREYFEYWQQVKKEIENL